MNSTIHLRFYEELNDFLPADKRKRGFDYTFEGELTAGGLLERLAVPLGKVEIVLANGNSVDLSHPVRHGESISFYPVFEFFNVRPLLRLRPDPLRQTRFVAATRLGTLANYLRLCGFDTLDASRTDIPEAVRLAEAGSRVVLTRKGDFPRDGSASRAWTVPNAKPIRQLIEVLQALDLFASVVPLGRCPSCNAPLSGSNQECLVGGARSVACSQTFSALCQACGRLCRPGLQLRRLFLSLCKP